MIPENRSGMNGSGIGNKVPKTRSKSHIELGSGLIEKKNDFKVQKKYGRIITKGTAAHIFNYLALVQDDPFTLDWNQIFRPHYLPLIFDAILQI